ncbi:DNA-directed RNA polymerase sigma-70 factor [Microtetraspora sp. NBRC 13810]|uniref:RNA polymerase sigma factor n=1 Tax=Microtetraspora sp. NBRC 13810 TaxID=3030990 RepID=UPI0024A42D11|nr:RNA polymerase sigma factor [Microtetraspora sp. NBRC 13810]GLW05343.1 DNA-directed RNA polymerase sigma-70 factor [Microtetraspora sp. NBRC 13810]
MDDERLAGFEAVYRETYSRIADYAARRCDSPQDAADVVAETFAVAWRRTDEMPRGEEAMPWLYGVARRVLANHRRGEVRRQARSAELDAEMADLYGADPESTVELRVIGEAFRTLSEEDREVLALVAWEELDREEIAAVLGLSRNAVRIRLHRARRRFSGALTRAGVRHTAENRLFPVGRSL